MLSLRYSWSRTNPYQGGQNDHTLETGIYRNCPKGNGEREPLTRFARFLLVAALAVGVCCAAPAKAEAPFLTKVARTPEAAQIHAKKMLFMYGWNQEQWPCLKSLWQAESNWRPDAYNKTVVYQIRNGKRVKLHAGGIPQKLNLNPKASVIIQISQGLKYIKSRYETPCNAWSWHKARNSY